MKHEVIYAHTYKNCPDRSRWQTLKDHQERVASLASEFAKAFGSSKWAKCAAILHDLGKIDRRFQKKLCDIFGIEYEYVVPPGRVSHSDAGAAYADAWGTPAGRSLMYLVAGHHAGLPDYQQAYTRLASWEARREDAEKNLKLISDRIGPFLTSLDPPKGLPDFVNSKNYHLWIRMLFSCLVDADRLDTERFMDPEKYESRRDFPTLKKLDAKLDEHMAKFDSYEQTDVNRARREILGHCREAAKMRAGLFSLTVPTGGGKTLSGMAFAMKHALENSMRRIIYVIPYTSIIEQTAKTLREVFGDDNVVEHHSNIKYEEKKEGEEEDPAEKKRREEHDLAAENWDAPIIVTTNVQFFESLYAARPSRCRKLHNIAKSVVLLDEAQLIPPEYLVPCVDVIGNLVRDYGVSIVLCTATQPSPPGLADVHEIIPVPQKYYRDLKRTKIHLPSDLNRPSTWEEIASRVREERQALCIVNTRTDCRTLYDLMPKGTIHLSALMCGQHRSDVIEEIKRRLKDGDEDLRVISTQLVEAGVDFDFPVVYRALAGLDSIAQAAGRCNREGLLCRIGKTGNVYVFVPPKPAPKGMLRKGEDITKELIRTEQVDMNNPALFEEYFARLYGEVNKTGKEIIEKLTCDTKLGVYFRHVGDIFQLIDDQYTVPVLVKYGEGEELIAELEQNGPSRDLMRELQRYTINLDTRRAEIFLRSGKIRQIVFHGDRGSVLVQNNESSYTNEFGFDIITEGIPSGELVL